MSEPAMPPGFASYLAERDRRRHNAVERVLNGMEPREVRLVGEAAVMGYVQGARAPKDAPIPRSTAIVTTVIDACLAFDDLYPVTASLGEHVPARHPREVAAQAAVAIHVPRCAACRATVDACVCDGDRTLVCSVCVTGEFEDSVRPPAPWPCPTLQVHGTWALCGADIEQPDMTATACPGALVFRPGDLQARCLTCGGWCGRLVANYAPAP